MKRNILLAMVATLLLCCLNVTAQEMIFEEGEDGYPYYIIRSEDGKTVGVQDIDGNVVIPLSEGFERIRYHKGFYFASTGSNEGSQHCCYTYEGKLVIEKGRYDNIWIIDTKNDNYYGQVKWHFRVEKDGKVGACDLTGKEVVAPEYDNLHYSFYGGESFVYNKPDSTRKYNFIRLNITLPDIKNNTPVIEQSAEFQKVWVEQKYENNKCISDIYADFTVYGMKNKKALIQLKIRDSKGKWVKMIYAKEDKDGSYYYETEFVPEYYGTVYSNKSWFMRLNKDLKLKNKKRYEIILTILSTTNGKTLAVSSPYSFIAEPKIDPSYTPTRTYTPVQSPVYPTYNYSKKRTTNNRTQSSSYNRSTTQRNTTSGSTSNSSIPKNRKKTCSACKGAKTVICHLCKGEGRDECKLCYGTGMKHVFNKPGVKKEKCYRCNGVGSTECKKCRGTGRLRCELCGGRGEL